MVMGRSPRWGMHPDHTQLTSVNRPCDPRKEPVRRGGSRRTPSVSGNAATDRNNGNRTRRNKTGISQQVTSHARSLNH
jgi:hypothetical protein